MCLNVWGIFGLLKKKLIFVAETVQQKHNVIFYKGFYIDTILFIYGYFQNSSAYDIKKKREV